MWSKFANVTPALEERVLRYDFLVEKLKNELRATMKKEEDQSDERRVGNREEEAGNSEKEL